MPEVSLYQPTAVQNDADGHDTPETRASGMLAALAGTGALAAVHFLSLAGSTVSVAAAAAVWWWVSVRKGELKGAGASGCPGDGVAGQGKAGRQPASGHLPGAGPVIGSGELRRIRLADGSSGQGAGG